MVAPDFRLSLVKTECLVTCHFMNLQIKIFYFLQGVDSVFVGSQLIKLDVEDGEGYHFKKKEYKLQPKNYQSYA